MQSNKWIIAAVLLSGMSLGGCAKSSEFDNEPAANDGAAKVVKVNGVEQIKLTQKAEQRLGIETGRITNAGARMVIPYAAVLYDADGKASAFTKIAANTYVEKPIKVDHVSGGQAILKSGPPAGTAVVTVGSAELLGTARGVEEE